MKIMKKVAFIAAVVPTFVTPVAFATTLTAQERITAVVSAAKDRLSVADDVAASKYESGKQIEDLPQEAIVMKAVDDEAISHGLTKEVAERVFHSQIEASKQVQRELHSQWKSGLATVPTHIPDLAQVRLVIAGYTTELINALKAAENDLSASECQVEVAQGYQEVVSASHLSQIQQQGLHSAVDNLCEK